MQISLEPTLHSQANSLTIVDKTSPVAATLMIVMLVMILILMLRARRIGLLATVVLGIGGICSLFILDIFTWHSVLIFTASNNTAQITVGEIGSEKSYRFPLTDVERACVTYSSDGSGPVYLDVTGRPSIMLYEGMMLQGRDGVIYAKMINEYLQSVGNHNQGC